MNITYEGKANFKIPENTIFPSEDNKIINIIANTNGETIIFECITEYNKESEALNATRKEIDKIEKNIFFTWNQKIIGLDWKIQKVNKDENTKFMVIKDHINMRTRLIINRNFLKEDIDNLISNIRTRKNDSDVYNLFLNILRMTEKTGSFIMLYSLLIVYVGPQQNKIDRYIKQKYPNVLTRQTTKEGASYRETIYTSLRNQLGHLSVSEDVNTETINSEINQYYDTLADLIKEMLIEKDLV